MTISLDTTDKKILHLLQINSKMNVKEIALKIGLTQTPTYERIKRLEKSGVIEHYIAVLNKEKIGINLEVFCQVTLLVHSKSLITKFEKAVSIMHEVIESYHVAGNYDYLLKNFSQRHEKLPRLLKKQIISVGFCRKCSKHFCYDSY